MPGLEPTKLGAKLALNVFSAAFATTRSVIIAGIASSLLIPGYKVVMLRAYDSYCRLVTDCAVHCATNEWLTNPGPACTHCESDVD